MLSKFTTPRRVVITGMGCVTPIGIGREAFWHGLQNAESGVRRIESFDICKSPVKIAAQVRDFDWEAQLSAKDRKHVPRTVPLALAAAREAFKDAGIAVENLSLEERQQIGVQIGTGGGGLPFVEDHYAIWYNGGSHSKASVYIIPAATHGTLSSELSMAFGLRGLSHVISTGCTSSTDAIAYAAQHIVLGRQEVMLAGGVDAPLAPGILAGFNLLTVLTTEWNDEPQRASRPFTRNPSGMGLGEEPRTYVLNEFERATQRGGKSYAQITGYGSTCDAYHRVRLQEGGDEPACAMAMSMADAGVEPSSIDYVNLHGTSTMLNDRIETNALKLALNSNAHRIPMSGTKSQVAHPQGAIGAAGLGAALCAMQTGIFPPTINLDEPYPDSVLYYVANTARKGNVRTALCNCIGFGSKNSALVVQKV